ncbi:glucodextranase DOMON-like domain-containing protein [Kutzneria albida]|uniref:Glucan 1,4-alpha-glucosidase n=1 Tax=Kutzneria albida DSM 43870 TaxID=1449976 RepID=W5W7T2_9PSEU|nr:glucodextranase DOMON-like domain-containing protein [Kutzneria albida]AHH96601.1 glucan 1,4-alpha-glucosidase [Kutzneria albida DSM 43870]
MSRWGLTLLTAVALAATGAPALADTAPGGPGTNSYFDLGRKDCLGTARNNTSKIWYTVANGVLSDVYEPTIDNTNVGTLQYVVTDGTFTDVQTRDTTYTVAADKTGMACTVTATSRSHGYQLVTTYVTDPARDSVVMRTRVDGPPNLRVYAQLDAHVNGNGGGGKDNGGADSGIVDGNAAVVYDTGTVSQAANRDYAVPTYLAMQASSGKAPKVGYAGSQPGASAAANGHIVASQEVTPVRGKEFTLTLGFGRTQQQAVDTGRASLAKPFEELRGDYEDGWRDYDSGLAPGTSTLDANVLKASVDKTFPGAVAASLASPWGQAVNAGALVGGKPVYFGSYREVFARDAYEAFTGFLAAGDRSTARAVARFLLTKQQLPTGEIPRNSLLNGKVAPDTGGDQLDETAYPILMAYLANLQDDRPLWTDHVKPAADYLVSHGPFYGVERWEEQSGYSPSTIAAEIAGLTAAAAVAQRQGDGADARVYQAAADEFQRSVKSWTVTSSGPYAPRYFTRLTKNGDPNSAVRYNLGNGGPTVDQRSVVDGGFQELVRLGELAPNDPDHLASLAVLDKQIAVRTATGTGYYRYGTSAAQGSADGYGECYQPSQSSCKVVGQPWPTDNTGTGHLWPVLSGERAESKLLLGDQSGARELLDSMVNSASGVGLVPEQAWESPDLAASPYGTDPATASIGFANGKAAGSAAPLTWAQAQRLRLRADLNANKVLDRPELTTSRYVSNPAPGKAEVTISSPAAGSTVSGGTTSVTGHTVAGAAVTVQSAGTDVGSHAATVSTTAGADGSFTVAVPVSFGATALSVGVSASANRTGFARVSVTGDLVGGTSVLDQADPAGDDHGPGTYQYPTAADFASGSFDLTRFQVISSGDTVYLRTTLANLVPTFGSTMGAQLLDIYVGQPGKATSTAAPHPSRNYSVGPWSQRVELQGFAAPVWVDAAGNQVGTPTAAVASAEGHTITVALPKAQFGDPAKGWTFAVVLTGQDGYSADLARGFTAAPSGYQFGVCAAGGTAPVCRVDPGSVPKAVDVLTPTGTDQATELDPTRGSVLIKSVIVP